jgi:hypothetical protein
MSRAATGRGSASAATAGRGNGERPANEPQDSARTARSGNADESELGLDVCRSAESRRDRSPNAAVRLRAVVVGHAGFDGDAAACGARAAQRLVAAEKIPASLSWPAKHGGATGLWL